MSQQSTLEICDLILKSNVKQDFEKLYEMVFHEIYHDEEPYEDKGQLLLMHYVQNPGIVDDVLVALCGWTMESLLEMAFGEG